MRTIRLWIDSIVSVVFLIFAATMYYLTSKIFTNGDFAMDPASYPTLIITVIVLLTLIMLVEGIRKGLRKAQADDASTNIEEVSASKINNPLKMILLLMAYAFGLKYLGFIIPTIAMVSVGTLMLGYRSYVRMTIVTIVVTLIIYFGFTNLLAVRFPPGLFF